MSWIDRIVESYWRKTSEVVSLPEESLGVFRWMYGFYVFLFATPYFSWVAVVPDGFFDPPLISIAYLFNGFPPGWIFQTLDFVTLIAVFFITIGLKTRLFTILLLALKIFGLSFVYSMGKIDHSILESAMLLCMIIAGWGKHYALFPDKKLEFESAAKGLSLLATFVCFGMFSAGIIKLLFWIDFDLTTSGFLTWYYSSYYNLDYTLLLMPYINNLPIWMYEIADYSAVIFEISGFIMLLWSRKTWVFWLLTASLFHLTNTLVLNIPFPEHVVVYLAFVNVYTIFGNLIYRYETAFRILTLVLFTIHMFQRIFYSGAEILFINNYQIHLLANVYSGLFLWTITVALMFNEFRKTVKLNK